MTFTELYNLLRDVEPIKMEIFIRSNGLKNDIIKTTDFLVGDVTTSRRIWHIINNNTNPQPLCPVCNKNPGNFGNIEIRENGKRVRSERGYRPCSVECRKVLISKRLSETEESRKHKFRQTCIEKYKVDHPHKNPEIANAGRLAVKSAYETNYDSIREKSRSTNLLKYGVEYHSQLSTTKEGLRLAIILNHNERIQSLQSSRKEKYQSMLGDEYEIIEYADKKNITILHNLCGHNDNYTYDDFKRRTIHNDYILCKKCNPKNNNISGPENQIVSYIQSLGFDPERTNKSLIKPKHIDKMFK